MANEASGTSGAMVENDEPGDAWSAVLHNPCPQQEGGAEPHGLKVLLYSGHAVTEMRTRARQSVANRSWMDLWIWVQLTHAALEHCSTVYAGCMHETCEQGKHIVTYFGQAFWQHVYSHPFFILNGAGTQFGCFYGMPEAIEVHEIRLGGTSKQRGLVYLFEGDPGRINDLAEQFLGPGEMQRACVLGNGAKLLAIPWIAPTI